MNNIIFTKATVFRNLKDYKFVPKLEEEKKDEIVDKLSSALKGKLSALNLSTANGKVVESLKINRLFNSNYQTIFVSEKDNLSISLFNEEHLNIVSTSIGYDKTTSKKVLELANFLANKITFSYNDQYGYLMSNLNNIGTGIKLECLIALPALAKIGKIDQIKRNVRQLGYQLKDVKNSVDTFTLSTICNLGFTENEICKEFDKMVSKLQDLEIESAKMYDVANHDELLDDCSRSVAILNSANLMNYSELEGHIKNLRLGLNLGLTNITLDKINSLQQLCINRDSEFISKSEMLNLAKKVKEILKK